MDVTYTPAIAEVIEKLEAGNPLPDTRPPRCVESGTDRRTGIFIP